MQCRAKIRRIWKPSGFEWLVYIYSPENTHLGILDRVTWSTWAEALRYTKVALYSWNRLGMTVDEWRSYFPLR